MKELVLEEMVNAEGFGNGFHGIGEKDDFDPISPPPFKIVEIRAAISKHCWVKNPWRSLSYALCRDVFVVIALAAAVIYFNAWISCPKWGWPATPMMAKGVAFVSFKLFFKIFLKFFKDFYFLFFIFYNATC